MDDRTREREIAQRRALGLKKLAKVFGTNGGDGHGSAAHTAEKKILIEILRSTREPNVSGLVRDRLAVLSARDDSEASDDAEFDFDVDFDVDAGAPRAGDERRNLKPRDAKVTKTVFSRQWTAATLRAVAKGSRVVPPALASGAFWEELVQTRAPELAHLTCTGGIGGIVKEKHHPFSRRVWLRFPEKKTLHDDVRTHGYAVLPRPEAFETSASDEPLGADRWTRALSEAPSAPGTETAAVQTRTGAERKGKETSLDDLADLMDALKLAGWPPIGIFAFDAAWRIVHELFFVAAEALHVDRSDVVLEPTTFAWALRNVPGAAAVGDEFSVPHRDYSCAEAWSRAARNEDVAGDVGVPNLICTWLPLTDATLDTGCMHVVPRQSDRLWGDPDHPDHLKPAARESDGGCALRFPVSAVRAVPAEAGSVCLWAGQTIHYGSKCRLTTDDLRGYEGEDPIKEGLVKVTHQLAGAEEKTKPPVARFRRPRRSLACTFRVASRVVSPETNARLMYEGGALPYMTQAQCASLTVADRARLIAQSLVLYSRWYELPAYLPGLHDDRGFVIVPETKEHTGKTSFVSA
jgi:hypothetical protein